MAGSKEALKIARQIVELESQIEPLKEQLSRLQRQFELIVSGQANGSSSLRRFISGAALSEPVSLTDQIKEIFRSSPQTTFSVQELLSRIPKAQTSTVRSIVSRLTNQEILIGFDRGRYKLRTDHTENSEENPTDLDDTNTEETSGEDYTPFEDMPNFKLKRFPTPPPPPTVTNKEPKKNNSRDFDDEDDDDNIEDFL